MSIFSSYKKIFLLGFIIIILIAIPFSVYIAQKRQQIQSEATPATNLSFNPPTSTMTTGGILSLDIILDPGPLASGNQVSFVKLSISFDPSKFSAESLKENTNSPNTLTSVLEDPVLTKGKATISLSIGADPNNALKAKAKIATLKLKALAPTESNNPSPVTFDSTTTQVLSIATSDKASENVVLLSNIGQADVTITGVSPTTTPVPSSTAAAPTPTKSSAAPAAGGGATAIETDSGAEIITEEPTPTIIAQDLFPSPTFALIDTKGGLPPTGPGDKMVGLGILGTILTIIGGIILISL
ncbi:MAG: hypothetical protein Q7K54_04005 [Candidatus Parcubacteria bacterium]|nr:hypothetical protein [Candidatus Parcubacteria bacterium]